ncbi:unnamed protein product, partial [Durusdinium trenchii]
NAGLLGGQDDPDEVFASSASDPEPDGMASDEKPDPDCEALPPNMDAVGVANFITAALEQRGEIVSRIQTALSNRETTVASICSGWGVAEMCIDALNEHLAGKFGFQGGRLTLAFSCECERFKVDWLRRAFPDVPVFNDMMDLGKGRAFDETSKNYTAVPKVDIVMDGYSCKSLSRQNNTAKSFLDTSSKSGQGFQALLSYVDYANPKVIICENVGLMAHSRQQFGGEKPIAIQNNELAKRGFIGFFQTVNSKNFGLRQLPADVFNTFKCGLLPVRMFLDCSGAATVRAAGIESNRGKSAQSGTKWKSGFKKRCKELGEADVMANLDKLRCYGIPLTDREYAILA